VSEHNINDSIWDDPRVLRLKQIPRNLLLYMMCSPRANIFGIYRLDFQSIERHQGITRQQAIGALLELSASELAHYDLQREVVWVVGRADECARSPSHWKDTLWRALSGLYRSPLVAAFVQYYRNREIVTTNSSFIAVDDARADRIVGHLSSPLPSMPFHLWLKRCHEPTHRLSTATADCGETPQLSLLDSSRDKKFKQIPTLLEVEVEVEVGGDLETPEDPRTPDARSAGARTRSNEGANGNEAARPALSVVPPPSAPQQPPEPLQPTPPQSCTRPAGRPPTRRVGTQATPEPPHDPAILRLWSAQESARSELRAAGIDPHSRPLGLVPGKTHTALLRERLAEHGEGVCQHVLACFVAEARRKSTLEFLNGITNWRDQGFARMMASSPEREKSRAAARASPRTRRRSAHDAVFARAAALSAAEAT
jgi:hypothetical protein